MKTTDPVRLTLLQSLLDEEHIPYDVFDQHMAALEAGIRGVSAPGDGGAGLVAACPKPAVR